MTAITDLFAKAKTGDKKAIAALLTAAQSEETGKEVDQVVLADSGQAYVVGVTGPPGAGKSTLISGLISEAKKVGRVAVLAIDPSSRTTQGAILGDRIRMGDASLDDEVFIRSVATRGDGGGLTRSAQRMVRVLDACGFHTIFLETVGVGQTELDVVSAADSIVLVLTPNSGDSVQMIKAGIIEIGDIFFVNKVNAKVDDSKEIENGVRFLWEGSDRLPAIVKATQFTDSTPDGGWTASIAALWEAIEEHKVWQETNGTLSSRREDRRLEEVVASAVSLTRADLAFQLKRPESEQIRDMVKKLKLDPQTAAEQLLGQMGDRS